MFTRVLWEFWKKNTIYWEQILKQVENSLHNNLSFQSKHCISYLFSLIHSVSCLSLDKSYHLHQIKLGLLSRLMILTLKNFSLLFIPCSFHFHESSCGKSAEKWPHFDQNLLKKYAKRYWFSNWPKGVKSNNLRIFSHYFYLQIYIWLH